MTRDVWLIADRDGIQEFALVPPGQGFVNWKDPVVWWVSADKRANCCLDSGPLAAMSGSCVHARRIRRLGLAGKLPTTLVDKNTLKPMG